MNKILLRALSLALFSAFAAKAGYAADPAPIKVGILLPLTGTFAAVAETQRDGALLAIDVVNKRGGLNMPNGKVKVEGVVADDIDLFDFGSFAFYHVKTERNTIALQFRDVSIDCHRVFATRHILALEFLHSLVQR